MNEYLFLFSITPVQAFIEQARKTQDLYAGSRILSHLCRTAIEASGLTPEQIIFPSYDPKSIDSGYCLPNRFLARFEADESTLKDLGEKVKKAVTETFRAMAETVVKKHTGRETLFDEEKQQIDTYLTINWVFVPVNGKYDNAYKQIERYLGAIKQVRTFKQLAETGRKCAICGERNVKFYRMSKGEHKKKASTDELKNKKLFTYEVVIVGYKEYANVGRKFLQPGEGLCAVCFAKRGAEEYFKQKKIAYLPNFPSTANIALLDAIAQLPVERQIHWQFTKFDGQVIFNKRQNVQKDVTDADEEELTNADELYVDIKDIDISPYYAVLRFDGDSMGNWLSGSKLAPGSDPFEFHKALSERLKAFAEYARTLVRPFEGKIVYVGGDDFLGFVTLNSLFAVLRRLRQAFRTEVHETLFKETTRFHVAENSELTFSAGVVVAHYKTPLSEALKWTHITEKAAKEANAEKDRFALAVLRHSGEIHHALFRWKEGDVWMPRIFHRIVTRIKKECFSTTFLDHLEREFRPLLDPRGEMSYDELLDAEITRLVKQSCLLTKRPHESRERFEQRKSAAIRAVSGDLLKLLESKSPKRWGENFFSALGIIDFFTRKAAQS